MRTRPLSRQLRTGFIALLVLVPSINKAAGADDPIQNAVKKGAKYLRDIHKPRDGYAGGASGVGTACLAGMAMLESGISEDDPSLKNIVKFVRSSALAQTRTYESALTIMFLDRLGQKADEPVIQFLGIRLMAGQTRTGGWSYDCGNALPPQEEARLRVALAKDSRLIANEQPKEPGKVQPRDDLPIVPKKDPKSGPKEPVKKEAMPVLHPEVLKWARLINQTGGDGVAAVGGDNSNTQFGILGLWCARRHGVPCDRSIDLTGRRFRGSQAVDGGWGYTSNFDPGLGIGTSSPAMTCAGLIGLAVAHGTFHPVLKNNPDAGPKKDKAAEKGADPGEDESIKRGLKCLGAFINDAKGEAPAAPAFPLRPRKGRRFMPDKLNGNLYFMWSLERTAVIFGLETIGNIDWYAWGADALVDTQQVDGSWASVGYPGANAELGTSFALLFLCRANIAKDLSANLKGKVKDPGVAVLRGGSGLANIPDRKLPAEKDPPKDPMLAKTSPNDNLYPPATVTPADFDKEAARLSLTLINSAPDSRAAILAQLRDSKGSVYTEALARAAAKLTGEAQTEAREALARRLTRMTATTLREMVRDDNREIRRGAAAACGLKEDRQYIPDLIGALSDSDADVVQSARSSLRKIAGKDFGPEKNADPTARDKAVDAWKAWLRTQAK